MSKKQELSIGMRRERALKIACDTVDWAKNQTGGNEALWVDVDDALSLLLRHMRVYPSDLRKSDLCPCCGLTCVHDKRGYAWPIGARERIRSQLARAKSRQTG